MSLCPVSPASARDMGAKKVKRNGALATAAGACCAAVAEAMGLRLVARRSPGRGYFPGVRKDRTSFGHSTPKEGARHAIHIRWILPKNHPLK